MKGTKVTTLPKGCVSGYYNSPLGPITIECTSLALVGLRFTPAMSTTCDCPLISRVLEWLECYFTGGHPYGGDLPIAYIRGTVFEKTVWDSLMTIPYGVTKSYTDIATIVAKRLHRTTLAVRAVSSAIGRNPIAIVIPCHRVLRRGGGIGGYAYGVDIKRALLSQEGVRSLSR